MLYYLFMIKIINSNILAMIKSALRQIEPSAPTRSNMHSPMNQQVFIPCALTCDLTRKASIPTQSRIPG